MTAIPGQFPRMKKQHTVLLLVLLIIIAVSIAFLRVEGAVMAGDESLNRILQVVAVVDSIAGLVIGFNLFKRNMLAARKSQEAASIRLARYAKACLQWWLLIILPAFVTITFFILTGDYAFIALGAMHWLIMLVFRPRKENIMMLLGLTETDLL